MANVQTNGAMPPPPPPGYSASDIVATTPSATAPSVPPPPPPGYAAGDVVPVSSTPVASTSTGNAAPPVAEMRPIQQPTGALDHIQRWANDVADDLRYGTNRTGIGSLLKNLGAKGLDYGNNDAVSDFVGSLPLGVLRAIKGGAEYFNPQQKVTHALGDVVGGGLQAATIPSFFVAPDAAELSAAGVTKAADVAGDIASKAGDAVRRPFSLKAVQEALANAKEGIGQELQSKLAGIQGDWHQAVRDTLDKVAQEAGVQPKPAQSLNDVAANTAAAIKAKASALYKTLDNAVGGTRFQTFDEQINNVRRALRNSAGIDPDADGRLVERLNDLEDSKAAALDEARSKGVDPNLIHEANATHRQAMALEDLSKHLRASMEGLRADVAEGLPAGVKAAPESLNPTKLSPRLNRMYNTRRLQQAVGDNHADEILQAVESTKQAAKDAAQNAVQKTEAATAKAGQQASNVKLARYAATSALAGIPGLGLLWHLLGE